MRIRLLLPALALVVLALFTAASVAGEGPRWLFARNYKVLDVFCDPVKSAAFTREYLSWEGKFFALVRHPKTGLSYDGFNLDGATGMPEKPRFFSAPSKECLDVAICVKALAGNPLASLVVSPGAPADAPAVACEILGRKMAGYEKFLAENPGYAGYLPWYESKDTVTPTHDWKDEFPGLDNGEWLWTMLVAEKVLSRKGHASLAKRYRDYNDRIRGNVVKIFYDGATGNVRGDIRFAPDGAGGFVYGQAPGKCTYLTGEHGVHEGMMLALYVSLFGEGLPADAVKRIWSGTAMKRVEHRFGTTWEGWYASAHESWAYLVLPMREIPGYRNLFRIREIIRTQNARTRGYPGLATSCLVSRNRYLDRAGIEGITSQPVTNNHIFTIYGAFPLLLECADPRERLDGNYGLAWLVTMLQADRMQGPFGGGEAGTNDGASFADVKTIDGSFTNVLALCGGLVEETAKMLRDEGKEALFTEILLGEYREAFGRKRLREPAGFALPGKAVPRGILGDYSIPANR